MVDRASPGLTFAFIESDKIFVHTTIGAAESTWLIGRNVLFSTIERLKCINLKGSADKFSPKAWGNQLLKNINMPGSGVKLHIPLA